MDTLICPPWFNYDKAANRVILDVARPKQFDNVENYKLVARIVDCANKLLESDKLRSSVVKHSRSRHEHMVVNQYVIEDTLSTDFCSTVESWFEKLNEDFSLKMNVYHINIEVNGRLLNFNSSDVDLEAASRLFLKLAGI